jgi:signal transduction histidine kinase
MKSLYRTILLWFILLLAASIAIILFASPMFMLRFSPRGGPIDRMNGVFFRQAREAFDQGGPTSLRAYLATLEAQLPARYLLVDPQGRDLVTGEDHRALLESTTSGRVPEVRGRFARSYSAKGFHFISLVRPDGSREGNPLYALLVATVIAVLCWLFATRLASPVRSLARTMERFGGGDISARSTIQRKDEIGDLARSFNQMAERITALVTSERQLLQDVSHELQSPLARMAVAAKLTRTAADRDAAAARLQKEITRLSEMVAGLLDITRAEGEPAALRRDPIDLRELVSDIVADCEWEADEKHCALRFVFEDATVCGNEELLRNAVRYSPSGEPVDVSLRLVNTEAEVIVRDQGPGVPDEALEKIFAPFYRVETSRAREAGGTGLGLSLAQRAVLLHQGTIRAENARPGLRVVIRLHTSQ